MDDERARDEAEAHAEQMYNTLTLEAAESGLCACGEVAYAKISRDLTGQLRWTCVACFKLLSAGRA